MPRSRSTTSLRTLALAGVLVGLIASTTSAQAAGKGGFKPQAPGPAVKPGGSVSYVPGLLGSRPGSICPPRSTGNPGGQGGSGGPTAGGAGAGLRGDCTASTGAARSAAREAGTCSGTGASAAAGSTVRGGSARAGSSRGTATTRGGRSLDVVETGWNAWWARNRDALLWSRERPSSAATTATTNALSGRGRRSTSSGAVLSRSSIYTTVVPTLVDILQTGDSAALLADAALALGRCVEPEFASVAEEALRPLLAHPDLGVAATAALSLGLTASQDVTDELLALLTCGREGHELVGGGEVPRLVRTAAALGLGFVGDPDAVPSLIDFVRGTSDALRETKAAALTALGFAPDAARADASEFLVEALFDRRLDPDIQAVVPTALARLLHADATDTLLARLEDKDTDRQVRRATVLALGAACEADALDAVKRLADMSTRERDAECRQFALMSLAKIGARDDRPAAHADAHAAIHDAIVRQLRDPKQKSDRPWAALAAGLYGRFQGITRGSLTERLSSAWDETRDPAQRGAFALGLGLLGARSMGRELRAEMLQTSDEVLAGQLAVALGLLEYREADGDLRALALREGASAGLRLDAGTGLRLMDDPLAAGELGASYADAGNLARREGLAAALAMLGRGDVLGPLDDVAADAAMDPGSRSSACAALGRLAEKTLLPWNAVLLADCPAAESPGDLAALLASAY